MSGGGQDPRLARDWKRSDARHHDAEAGRYDQLIGREFAPYQEAWTAEPWAELLAAEGARVVLDVGCGTGRTSLPIARRGPAVLAADMSRGMLRELRAKAAEAGLARRIWPLVADAERLPFADGGLDGLVCQGVLHHLPRVDAALAEADRVLRPGAWLCLAEPDAEASTLNRAMRAAAAAAARVRRPRAAHSPAAEHERPLEPAALIAPLERLGYAPRTAYLVHPPILFRFLSETMAGRVMRALNRGDRSRRRPADILVLRGRRPGAS